MTRVGRSSEGSTRMVCPGAPLMPVPVRLTFWGLPVALSVTVSEAARLPLAEGVKLTLIEQLAPACKELPQLLASTKSLALAPLSTRLEMLKVELPVLDSFMACVALVVPLPRRLKVRLVGEMMALGAVLVPMSAAVWGLPAALSVRVMDAVRYPFPVGL